MKLLEISDAVSLNEAWPLQYMNLKKEQPSNLLYREYSDNVITHKVMNYEIRLCMQLVQLTLKIILHNNPAAGGPESLHNGSMYITDPFKSTKMCNRFEWYMQHLYPDFNLATQLL